MPTEQTPTPRPKRATAKTAPKSPAASTSATNAAAAGKPAAGKPAAAASGAVPSTPTKPTKPTTPAAPAAVAKPATDKSGISAKAAARPSDIAARMIDPEQRRALIAEAAYLRAESRNFAPGYEVEDWLSAESEIDTRLMLGAVPPIK